MPVMTVILLIATWGIVIEIFCFSFCVLCLAL